MLLQLNTPLAEEVFELLIFLFLEVVSDGDSVSWKALVERVGLRYEILL